MIMNMKYLITTLTLVAIIGIALPVFAEDDDRKETRAAVVLDATQMACISTAITKRESALITGHDTYAASIKSAYTVRSAALASAWTKTDPKERRTAVKTADRAFYETTKTARKTWNTARRSAWKAFETDRKACAPQAGSAINASDTGSAKVDASL